MIGEGVGIAHLEAEGVAGRGFRLRLGEAAGTDGAHHVDGADDEEHAAALERVGAQAQLFQRGLRAQVAGEEEIRGAPAQPDEREQTVAGGGGRGDELLGERDSRLRVLRRQQHVMAQGQRLRQGVRVPGLPRRLHRRQHRLDRSPAVGVLGGQPRDQPRAQRDGLGRQRRQRAPLQRVHARGVVREPVLAQPHAAEAERGARQQRRVVLGLGELRGAPEERARLGQLAAGEHRLRPLDDERGGRRRRRHLRVDVGGAREQRGRGLEPVGGAQRGGRLARDTQRCLGIRGRARRRAERVMRAA